MNKPTLKQYFDAFRVKVALKLVLAGIICILINNIFHFELGYFALLFSFLMVVLFHGEVLVVGSQALVASIISGSISLVIAYIFIDSKVLYIFLMSVLIFIVVSLLVKYFLAMLISGVSATMTMYNSIYGSVPDATTLFENYTIQLIIATIVCVVIDQLVWPSRSRGAYELTLKSIYQELSELFISFNEERISDRKSHKDISTSLITFSNLVTYVNRMQKEEKDEYSPIDQHVKIITLSRGIFIKTEVLEEYILKNHSFLQNDQVKQNLTQVFEIISQSFSTMSESIGTRKILNIKHRELQDLIYSLHEQYRNMHEIEGMEDQYYDDLYAFGAMLPVLDEISDKIKSIINAINLFHKDKYRKLLESRVTHTDKLKNEKRKSFFKIDKQSAIVGFKTVVIFLILMFGEVIIGLPGGGQVVFFAILFGVIPNLGQAYMKSKYGILGVTSGLVLSFLSLMLVSISPHFLIVLFVYSLGTFICAYIASSSKDISVSGLQAGLLFPFGILLTTGPTLDISDAYTRFLALLSAVFIGIMVQHLLWPTNPYKLLKQKISKSIDFSGQIVSKLLLLDIRDQDKFDDLVLPLAASLPTITSLLHDAEYIIREDELHADQFIHIVESIETIYVDVETLKRTIYNNKNNELMRLYLNKMEPYYVKMCGLFHDLSNQFDSQSEVVSDITSTIEEIEKYRAEFRESDIWRTFKPEDVEETVLLTASIDSLLLSLKNISSAISEISIGKLEPNSVLKAKEA